MVGVGLWIRLGILETPVFRKVVEEERVERVPVLEVLKHQPKQVVLTALLRLPEQAPGYIFGAFVFTYGTTVLGQSRNFLLIAVLVSAVVSFLWVTVAGHLSDRLGRKRMYIIGCIFVAVFGFVYFGLLNTQVPALIFLAVALSGLPIMTMYGPEAALIAESFSPRLRYSGASLGYQLASIIAGGPSPFIATALVAAFASSFPIALYILGCAVVGIVSTALLTDYTHKDISEEYDKIEPAPATAG
jgi:MFS family permease